jgi:hypothetical protein
MLFNNVIDLALAARGLRREDVYVTQVFHLVPDGRSQGIRAEHLDRSFEQVTRHELIGRHVLALGNKAARACTRYAVPHVATCHPSRRGYSKSKKAEDIAAGLAAMGF